MKTKILIVRITENQEKILLERARKLGLGKSPYVRFALFKILKE